MNTWAQLGVRHAVISPGSRSTPLALALVQCSDISVEVRLDERSSGFFALGLSKVTGVPTIVVTTSGTAATELRPAVTEAYLSSVPLLICTTDRPPELHGVGAPQTVTQTSLFDDVVNLKLELGVPRHGARHLWPSLASQAYAASCSGPLPSAPVHINLPFDEPLYDSDSLGVISTGGTVTRVLTRRGIPSDADLREVFAPGQKGLIVLGAYEGLDPGVVFAIAELLSWPVLVDLRAHGDWAHGLAIRFGDLILRSSASRMALAPQIVLRVGESPSSKSLSEFIASRSLARGGDTKVVSIPASGRFHDPERIADLIWHVDAQETFKRAQAMTPRETTTGEPGYFAQLWTRSDAAVGKMLEDELAKREILDEPSLAHHLLSLLSPGDLLFASSSMPIRDLEWFGARTSQGVEVLANRGANGIDGVLSSFQGAALAHSREHPESLCAALIGDLGYLYDFGSLLAVPHQKGLIVVNDNDGGAIFSFLPQRTLVTPEEFETIFGTPHGRDLLRLSRGVGIDATLITSQADLADLVATSRAGSGLMVGIFKSERARNLARHEQLYQKASDVVETVVKADRR